MKELTIEQKARRYDEALKVASKYKDIHIMFSLIQDEMFPEIAESEDEQIKKKAIEYIEAFVPYDDKDDIIDWLEKQGEQKPATWSEEDENNILFLTSIIEECFKDKEKITLCSDTVCANFTKENVIDRLKSLSPQSHCEWSEEDEANFVRALAFIKNTSLKDVDTIKESVITWIKSIKERIK